MRSNLFVIDAAASHCLALVNLVVDLLPRGREKASKKHLIKLTFAFRFVSVAEIELGFETTNSTEPLSVRAEPDTPTLDALGVWISPIPTLGGRANWASRSEGQPEA